jgi:hypothetical protein
MQQPDRHHASVDDDNNRKADRTDGRTHRVARCGKLRRYGRDLAAERAISFAVAVSARTVATRFACCNAIVAASSRPPTSVLKASGKM